MVIQF